jgi:putative ABC transport system permease protein
LLALTTVETMLVGAASKLTGILGGYPVLHQMTATTIPAVLREIGVTATVFPTTIAQALALGIPAIAVAPLFTVRRLHRMDIPATLRMVE